MSCGACEEAQELMDRVYPYRLGAANILIIACPEHALEAIVMLNAQQQALRSPDEAQAVTERTRAAPGRPVGDYPDSEPPSDEGPRQ